MASPRPKTLNFITSNKNKLAEVEAILGDVVELQSKSLDLVEIQGMSDEIALDKCRRAAAVVSTYGKMLMLMLSLREQANGLVYVKARSDDVVVPRSMDQSLQKIRLSNSTL